MNRPAHHLDRTARLLDSQSSSARLLACAVLSTLLLGGCAWPLETTYGRQRTADGYGSVNGTDILAKMFSLAGHEVVYRRMLITPKMESVDTIVWAPNDFAAPSEEACEWFDQWLSEKPGRTLIYVGRDFNATHLYWEKATPLAPPEDRERFKKNQDVAIDNWMRKADDRTECEWFKIEVVAAPALQSLRGPWAEGIDAKKSELSLHSKLVGTEPTIDWLTAGDEPIVSRHHRKQWGSSQLITVANGSFLLNLPLLNTQHRRLAGKLIESVGAPGRVVFLQSTVGGPPIDPEATSTLWQVFGAWPLNVVLLHLAVVGVIFCFASWPIFGRPRTPAERSASDFGDHVTAVGKLLGRTKDRGYAESKLAEAGEMGGALAGPHPAASPPDAISGKRFLNLDSSTR